MASDGGVFAFGDAGFYGSAAGRALPRPVMAMAAAPGGAVPPNRPPQEPASPAPAPTPPNTAAPAPPPPPLFVDVGLTFDVGLIGDTGYTESQGRALEEVRVHMNRVSLAFTVHDGDIWSEGTACTEDRFQEMLDTFNGFAHPFVYTPGDNEWTDCTGSTSSKLATIRRLFFPTDETLGRRRMAVTRQHPTFVENARWHQGGVVFATLNEPGPDGRGGSHRDANIAWLNAAFDEAEAAGAPGVMIIWQDNPFEPSGGRLAKLLKERTIAFGKPVVLVHGDTHQFRIDHPWSDVDHFTRVETYGDTSSPRWVRATVDPASPEVFSFEVMRG